MDPFCVFVLVDGESLHYTTPTAPAAVHTRLARAEALAAWPAGRRVAHSEHAQAAPSR